MQKHFGQAQEAPKIDQCSAAAVYYHTPPSHQQMCPS